MNGRWAIGLAVVALAAAAAWLAMPSTDTGDVPEPPAVDVVAAEAAAEAPAPGDRPELPRAARAAAVAGGSADVPDGIEEVAGDDEPDPGTPSSWWGSDRLQASAAAAVTRKVGQVREDFDAAIDAVRDGRRRDELRKALEGSVRRMREIEDEVAAGADPVDAYTRIHDVKQQAIKDVQAIAGTDAGPALEAMGVNPDGTDPDLGWGIPLEEVGWDAVFSEE